eukprot:CAMPEP_0167789876 /NCGR_PEP_ID=MMETSP0111_2-20121227/10960_1 /TAXON_ID=91324 /ORGANISM="Lotharella globosa, Strain CCCM811" /LENGTH=309 /DNA_ID=CAMNT_0007682155 /DNA_START=200 /DNA_END=1129 /DNA_ORIENTATION=+
MCFYILPGSLLLSCVLVFQLGVLGSLWYVLPLWAVLFALSRLGRRERPFFRKFGQIWYEIFDFSCNLSTEQLVSLANQAYPNTNQSMIIAMHPHGIIPIHAWLWAAFCDQYMHNVYGFGAVASVVMYMPIIRTLCVWLTCVPASYAHLKRGLEGDCPPATLAGRKPGNLYILAGGIAEVFTSTPGRDIIVYRGRRGLCRLALEKKAKIIPIYVFGGTGFFHNLLTGENVVSRVFRKMKLGVTMFWGQCLLPIPLPAKVSMAIGDPVEIPEGEGEEAVGELHLRYLDAMERLFEETKVGAGYPEAKLEIR